MTILHNLYWVYQTLGEQKSTCLFFLYLIYVAFVTSTISLLLIFVDRYIAIIYHMRYLSVMTTGRSTIIIAGIWIYSIFSAPVRFFGNRWVERRIEVVSLMPEVVMPDFVTMFAFPKFLILAIVMIYLHAIIFKDTFGSYKS